MAGQQVVLKLNSHDVRGTTASTPGIVLCQPFIHLKTNRIFYQDSIKTLALQQQWIVPGYLFAQQLAEYGFKKANPMAIKTLVRRLLLYTDAKVESQFDGSVRETLRRQVVTVEN